jgi:hypothetical protein
MKQLELFSDKKHQTKVRVYEEWLRRPAGIPLLQVRRREKRNETATTKTKKLFQPTSGGNLNGCGRPL